MPSAAQIVNGTLRDAVFAGNGLDHYFRRMPTILLVEDNTDNRVIYSTYLRHIGYVVLEAEDGEAGLTLACEHRPDVVLMDVGLPRLDGYEATRRLKADPATRHIPVVALTAHALAADRAQALEAGCDLHLAKPLEPRALGVELQRILGTTPGASERT